VKKFLTALFTLFITTSAIAKPLVVYSGRSEALVGPIFEQFTQDTGIELDVRYNSSPAIATQLLQEREASPADVVFLQETGYLSVLANANMLQTLPSSLLEQVPERFQEEQGRWMGTSARARVLAYNTNLISEEELPKSLKELADPKYDGKLGWAPSNASFQAHVSGLRTLWGEEATEQWLQAMIKNHPTAYPKNAVQVSAAGTGEITIGWVNHYYLHRLKQQQPDLPVKNYSFPEQGDAGNMLMIVGAAITQTTDKQEQAEALLNYLVSEDAQLLFANEVFEYPASKAVATNLEVPSLDSIDFVEVDQRSLANIGLTLEMLKRNGLL
jgi:iron(III) transport system substrate-binding protein